MQPEKIVVREGGGGWRQSNVFLALIWSFYTKIFSKETVNPLNEVLFVSVFSYY